MPAMSEGSPPPRCRSDGRNQFQHFVCPLRGVSHEAGLFFRDEVHPRAGGKILHRLRAAVEHDHQRDGLALIAARDEQPVVPASRGICVDAFDEPSAVGHDVGHGRRRTSQRSSQSKPGKIHGEVQRRPGRASRTPRVGGVRLGVDGRRLSSCNNDGVAGRRGGSIRSILAPKHALEQRGGLDDLARAREACGFENDVPVQHGLTSFCRREPT